MSEHYVVDWRGADGKQRTTVVRMLPVATLKDEHLKALAKGKLQQAGHRPIAILSVKECKP
jgi:hypothetical protein